MKKCPQGPSQMEMYVVHNLAWPEFFHNSDPKIEEQKVPCEEGHCEHAWLLNDPVTG